MSYTVEIRKLDSGDTVTRDFLYTWGDGSLYWWTDGNFGCDCNRGMEFHRGAGTPSAWIDVPCNCASENAYLVRITLPDGQVVLNEFGEMK